MTIVDASALVTAAIGTDDRARVALVALDQDDLAAPAFVRTEFTSALGGETVLPIDLGPAEGSGVVVVVAPDVAHVLADSGDLVLAAFPIEGHAVLTSPEPLEDLRTVTFDGITSTP
mgnify:CR=1 FL=1